MGEVQGNVLGKSGEIPCSLGIPFSLNLHVFISLGELVLLFCCEGFII